MSIHSMQSITCEECGHTQQFVIWETLNGDLNPDAKQLLLDGSLFNYKCEHCGYEANIIYNILYHDMSQNAMVFFVEDDNVDVAKEQIELARQATIKLNEPITSNLKIPNTRHRIVTSQNRLREKAIIFNAGLDDRVVEIVKLLCWVEIRKQFQDVRDDELYFLIKDDNYMVVAPSKGISCNVPKEMYKNAKRQFGTLLNLIGDNEYIVNNNFAGMLFMIFNDAHSEINTNMQ